MSALSDAFSLEVSYLFLFENSAYSVPSERNERAVRRRE
jgi:hypothetical protein